MLSHTVSILLGINLLICPVCCRMGVDHGAAPDTAVAQCCEACRNHTAPPTQPGSSPSDPPTSEQDTCCQCICAGAVVESSSQPIVELDVLSWTEGPHLLRTLAAVSERHGGVLSWTLLPNDAMNPGRAKRCLMMSYRC